MATLKKNTFQVATAGLKLIFHGGSPANSYRLHICRTMMREDVLLAHKNGELSSNCIPIWHNKHYHFIQYQTLY